MATIPSQIAGRFVTAIKRFQPLLLSAKVRDANESDTILIVASMLSEIFGYQKHSEITSEHAIHRTFCDLATMLDGKVRMFIEVKPIGIGLKEAHVKPVIDYAAKREVEWVALTNGIVWRVYKVTLGKPIGHEFVFEIDFLILDVRNEAHLKSVYEISKERYAKEVPGEPVPTISLDPIVASPDQTSEQIARTIPLPRVPTPPNPPRAQT